MVLRADANGSLSKERFLPRLSLNLNTASTFLPRSSRLGKPNFSTDSAVAQYADELQCGIIFKASTVDGVYDRDPHNNPNAVRYTEITYKEAIAQDLGIMDTTAFAMCKKSGIPIFVFNINNLDRLPQILDGDHSFGTLIHK